MTLNSQKQCSLSYLLNAAVRSRLWRVPTFWILLLVQLLYSCLNQVAQIVERRELSIYPVLDKYLILVQLSLPPSREAYINGNECTMITKGYVGTPSSWVLFQVPRAKSPVTQHTHHPSFILVPDYPTRLGFSVPFILSFRSLLIMLLTVVWAP